MRVINRQGDSLDVSYDEIKKRISRLCDAEMLAAIDIDRVVIQTINGIYDGISTAELDDLSARICASLQSVHFVYDALAARILVSNIAKNVRKRLADAGGFADSFSGKTAYAAAHAESTLDPAYVAFVAANAAELDAAMRYERDATHHSYFSLRTLEKSYLMRIDGQCVETPQDMWMRVAVVVGGPDAANVYDDMSRGDYTHATPTLFNAGMRVQQCSSCFVAGTEVPTVNAGVKRIEDVAIGDVVRTHTGAVMPVSQLHRNARAGRALLAVAVRGEAPVVATVDHRFWAMSSTDVTAAASWVRADELIVGAHMVATAIAGGGVVFVHIDSVAPRVPAVESDDVVYTLGVEEDHSYAVGRGGLVAQNCYLLGTDDSLSGIFKTLADCAQISKWAGGIGLHVSNVRAKGSRIASTNGTSDGIVPMLKVYNECARYCNQSGRRKGSIAIYLEPWHADVWEFVELRRNVGAETERTRDLFLALWVPDEFMRRLEADEDWFLMSPDACPGLVDAFDADAGSPGAFSALYGRYIAEGKYIKKVRARVLWQHVLNCQLETGVPYVMYKDHVNRKCNQSNVGTIRSSNLCVAPETHVLTSSGYHRIAELEGKAGVKVWNGVSFSDTVVRKTGVDQPLVKVHFSNGEELECTPYHKFYVLESDAADAIVVEAKDLQDGAILAKFSMPVVPDAELMSGFVRDVSGLDVPVNYVLSEKLRWLEALMGRCFLTLDDSRRSITLQVPSANAPFLLDVKRMLNTMGTDPKIATSLRSMDGLRLIIDSVDLAKLHAIGFKCAPLDETETPQRDARRSVVVTDVRDVGRRDDTYCFTEPLEGKGVFNGILTGNCAEITEYSDESSYAVCNLASIAVNRFVSDGAIDFPRLHAAAKQVTRNLNRVIDVNTYPTPESKRSNVGLRPIGVGVQGLGDLYCMLGLPYDDPRAVALDAEVMETIYHGCLEASCEMAEQDGPYDRFAGSPASEGRLQFDMWGVEPTSGRYDWAELKARVREHGLRNSLLTALMPTATTSQILGNCESFEPIQANVYKRSTMAGEFVVVNRHLMRDLMARGLWSEDLRRRLLARDGSVQALADVPEDLKRVYRTVWEVPQRAVIDHAAARGPFVDQSQSMNLYLAAPSFQKLSSALVHAWRCGLKTGVYYLRSTAAVEAIKYGILPQQHVGGDAAQAATATAAEAAAAPACRMRRAGEDGTCEMCSA